MTLEFIPSPNFTFGGNTREFLVIHGTGGSFDSTLSWVMQSEAQVSYHYLISKDGRAVQLVSDEHRAWHAGASRWSEGELTWTELNRYSIGIGLESMNRHDEVYPLKQLIACHELTMKLLRRYRLPKTRVLTHNNISAPRKVDPVAFDLEYFRDAL